VIQTPIRAPQANAYAERFVRTVRAECLDWLLIVGRRHLEHVLRIYTAHYNRERVGRTNSVSARMGRFAAGSYYAPHGADGRRSPSLTVRARQS
jgi:transposase InsO family protein